jgi:hypothetical protein
METCAIVRTLDSDLKSELFEALRSLEQNYVAGTHHKKAWNQHLSTSKICEPKGWTLTGDDPSTLHGGQTLLEQDYMKQSILQIKDSNVPAVDAWSEMKEQNREWK